ncbi:MAG: ATP-binding protein [Candidatus Bilamarchaeaceae archaeon]
MKVKHYQKTNKVSETSHTLDFLSSFDEAMSVAEDYGEMLVVYGPEGVGKSSWSAYAPGPVCFVCGKREHGIHTLKRAKLVPQSVKIGRDVQDWNDLLRCVDELIEGDHDFRTVVFDSLTVMEHLCFTDFCNEHFNGDWSQSGFMSFMSGPRSAAESYWPQLLDKCLSLRSRGVNVIYTAHSLVKAVRNPEGADYDRFVVSLTDPIWKKTAAVCDAVLFMKHFTEVSKIDQEGKRMARAKALGGDQRVIMTEYDAAYDAKNRYGLPTCIGPAASAEELAGKFWKLVSDSYKRVVGKGTK